MTKATVRITKISRDAKVTFKVLSYFLASDLTRMLNANQMIINLTTQNFEIVKFRIESKDIDKNLVTLKLLFNNSKNISPGTVRNLKLILFQELDKFSLTFIDDIKFRKDYLQASFIPNETTVEGYLPPQISECRF